VASPEPARHPALYCYAISDKRYALFNLTTDGEVVLRKGSAHGLGHLLAPYGDEAPSPVAAPRRPLAELGLRRWQHDLWVRVIEAVLSGARAPKLDDLPNMDAPVVARYSCSTPRLLAWFRKFNKDRPYRDQVRPGNFLLALQVKHECQRAVLKEEHPSLGAQLARFAGRRPAPVAAFHRDPRKAAETCFDRQSGEPISSLLLQTYGEALATYWLHPVDKLRGADYLEHGHTEPRHVHVTGIVSIGKEAHRLEERQFLGDDPEAQVIYGEDVETLEWRRASILEAVRSYGVRELARASGLSTGLVSGIRNENRPLSEKSMQRLGAILLEQGWLRGDTYVPANDLVERHQPGTLPG
jgi:hypothetical protein